MNNLRYNLIFVGLLFLNFLVLLFSANDFSISYGEATIFFQNNTLLSYLIDISTSIFGQNDIALRLPFILFYIGSVIISYLLTDDYFKKQSYRLISIIIFMLLPGVVSAALLVNSAIMVIFFTLLYLYLFKLTSKEHYWLLVVMLFVDNSFAIMYLALFFYSLKKKDNMLLIVSLILFGISMQMYGFDSGGKPRGYFIDTFNMYASIFSPVIFLYFFYTLYRIGLKGEKDLYWYISFTALIFSLILSLRQKILIDDFAPFVVISIPLMVKLFLHSYNVRLPRFRKNHQRFAIFGLLILSLNFLILIFNKPLYFILPNPNKHFAIKYHFAKELALYLKAHNIHKVLCQDYKLQKRLKFYGIEDGNKIYVTSIYHKDYLPIEIKYLNKTIYTYYMDEHSFKFKNKNVTKLNSQD